MDDLGDKLESGEKDKIEAAIKDLEEALKGDDKDAIDAKVQALSEASSEMAQRIYAEQSQAASDMAGEQGGAQSSGKDDDVVDAEFEEVKDDKK